MKDHLHKLNNSLSNINYHLAPIAEAAQLLIESGALEKLTEHLPELINFLRRNCPVEEPKLFMPDVLRYLGISERSYYRKIAEGKLVPRKWQGPDFFYRSDLEEERKESKRRGRI